MEVKLSEVKLSEADSFAPTDSFCSEAGSICEASISSRI
jgi:hypothetical protein